MTGNFTALALDVCMFDAFA
ncbi:DUF645 family protein [Vibrio cholerae]|nr:DUF645 family protein [Vibrio cholerae]